MNNVVAQESLQSYFNRSIQHALLNQHVEASDHTVVYLSGLLENFALSKNLFETTPDGLQLKPLALYYADAISAESRQLRTLALRKLGDVALFISGLFTNSLAAKPVDVDYYVSMGGCAYSCLYTQFEETESDSAFSVIYYELSHKFVQFMDILSEINSGSRRRDLDFLRQYEIWQKTGSAAARKKLSACGLDPATIQQLPTRH